MKIAIINTSEGNNTKNIFGIVKSLEHFNSSFSFSYRILNYKECRDTTYDGYIFSGRGMQNPRSTYKEILEHYSWIKDIPPATPIIGICGGMQRIAIIYGAKLADQRKDEIGAKQTRISLHTQNYILSEFNTVTIGYTHSYFLEKPLSTELDLIASTDLGPAIYKHNSRNIIGFQGHPEQALALSHDKYIRHFHADEISYRKARKTSEVLFYNYLSYIKQKLYASKPSRNPLLQWLTKR